MQTKELAYKNIENEILRRIRDGVYRNGQKLPPERTLQKEFAVSRMTVSKGLSNLEACGYISRTQGRGSFVKYEDSPVQKKRPAVEEHGIIKYISPGAANGKCLVSNGILEGIYATTTPQNYHVGVDYYDSVDHQLKLLNSYISPFSEGFAIWPTEDPRLAVKLKEMQDDGFPFVLVDTFFPEFDCDYILTNNAAGSQLMIDHLVSCGHRKICYVTVPPDRISLSERLSGVISSLGRNNIPLEQNTILITPKSEQIYSGLTAVKDLETLKISLSKLFDSPEPPTAIFACNDWLAMIIYDMLETLGISVPNDISLAGFDNIDASECFKKPLTTIAQDFNKIGQIAGKILLERKNPNTARDIFFQHHVQPKLIIRDSVKQI